MQTAYQEMFQTRKKIHDLKMLLGNLCDQCKTRCTNKIKAQIDSTLEEIEGLKLRMLILEKLSKSSHY